MSALGVNPVTAYHVGSSTIYTRWVGNENRVFQIDRAASDEEPLPAIGGSYISPSPPIDHSGGRPLPFLPLIEPVKAPEIVQVTEILIPSQIQIERIGEEPLIVYESLPSVSLRPPVVKQLPEKFIPPPFRQSMSPFIIYWMPINAARSSTRLFDQRHFFDQLDNTERIAMVDEGGHRASREPAFDKALTQITVPEMIIYNEYFDGWLPKYSFLAVLDGQFLSFRRYDTVIRQWKLSKEKKVECPRKDEVHVDQIRLYELRGRLILVTKHVWFGPYFGQVKLTFIRNSPTPIAGQMAFHFRGTGERQVNTLL